MADQNVAAAQGDGRRGTVDPYEQSCFKFEEVLRHELAIVAARRERLDTERGELKGGDAPEAAWNARLLGLSFSGGGIRSATFNLGVLQALAGRGVLRYIDYLSTVSGGGYIGSWLTALSQRRFARTEDDAALAGVDPASLLEFNAEDFRSFEQQLAWSAGDGRVTGDKAGQDEHADKQPAGEDRAIRFLREFSNYLTPRLGLFSGDTWALISIYVRNALLNQLVLLLGLAGVLLFPRLLSPALARADAKEIAVFLLWMLAAAIAHVFICLNLGKDLSRVAAVRDCEGAAAQSVLWRIGFPLLLIGISATSWLGYISTWRWPIAVAVGAAVSFVTWTLAGVSARWHARRADEAADKERAEQTAASEAAKAADKTEKAEDPEKADARKAWSKVAQRFWKQMVLYSALSGAVFGLLLHAVSAWLFSGAYSGFKLIAAPPALALAILLAGVLHVGLAGKNVSAQYTEWLSRLGGIVLIGSIGWLAFNGLVFFAPLLVAWLQGLWQAALSSGWILTTLGSVVFGRSVAASSGRWSRLFMTVAPYIFIVGLGVAAAAALQAGLHEAAVLVQANGVESARTAVYERFQTDQSGGQQIVGGLDLGPLLADYGTWLAATEIEWLVLAMMVLAFGLTWFVAWRIDINVFSLNGMYANRLVRCYLGASVTDRKPNRFSGLSSRDDLQLKVAKRSIKGLNMFVHPLADGGKAGLPSTTDEPTVYPGPYHLINTAINLVSGGNLAYQERKAGAFLLSPLYCGFTLNSSSSEGPRGPDIDDYRRTSKFSSNPRQFTLGEAVATSGAAASPNMGYHSTPAFAFLLSVFNIRLGRWVGNPHTADRNDKTWQKTGPKIALFHLLREVFGLTDKDSGYVYLSDGGHFENLGIYELVRRRCRYIIACDAGADPSYAFEDLGNAIRKCRTDLGVEIDLDIGQIATIDALHYNGAPCAIGSIRYSEEQVGTILYIKASRRAGAPSDVLHYASQNTAFPHESTADQFFSESQFESYRRLGHFLGGVILGASRTPTAEKIDTDRLFRNLSERWYRPSTSIASNFGRLSEEVDELFERLRTSKELGFLSRQFYPEWRSLLGHAFDAKSQTDDLTFVPKNEDELRQGFYFCNSLIQLMESVYVSLNLETEWQHPDNSGWINVFNHWAWSGMFRVTWAASAATYGGRFRAFCERRLSLTLGDVEVKQVLSGTPSEAALAAGGLNKHEQHQVLHPYIGGGKHVTVYGLELCVCHPLKKDSALTKFGFGYAVTRGDELVMYRVQDHLRGMGLGRRGLVKLLDVCKGGRLRLGPPDVEGLLEFFADFKEQTDRAKLADFRAMVVSVNEEAEQREAGAT
jgi:patatin-like phospholipase